MSRAWRVACAALLAVAALPAAAAQAANAFVVKVVVGKEEPIAPPPGGTGDSGPPAAGDFCRATNVPGAFGAEVTVVCRTGVVIEVAPGPEGRRFFSPTHGAAYRYLLPFASAGVIGDDSTLHTGLGTVTSWRVVQMADREYLEMTVRW